MRYKMLLAAWAALVLAGSASAVPREESTPYLVTTWGATNPGTRLAWNFDQTPTPDPGARVSERLLDFNFPAVRSTRLDREGYGACRYAVEKLRARGDLRSQRVLIAGHCDCSNEHSGDTHDLGLRRARAAADYLVRLGVPRKNIQLASFGHDTCIAEPWEKLRQGWERRVSLWVLEGGGMAAR